MGRSARKTLGLLVASVLLVAFAASASHYHDLPAHSCHGGCIQADQATVNCPACALLKNTPTPPPAAAPTGSAQPMARHDVPPCPSLPSLDLAQRRHSRAPPSLLG